MKAIELKLTDVAMCLWLLLLPIKREYNRWMFGFVVLMSDLAMSATFQIYTRTLINASHLLRHGLTTCRQ